MRRTPIRLALPLVAVLAVAGAARAENLLANPGFDSGLAGWRVDFPQVHFAGPDAGFDPESGSMQVDLALADPSGASFAGRQCVAAEPGVPYRASALTALLGPDRPRAAAFLEVLDRPPPQLLVHVVARDEAVVLEPLPERHVAGVVEPLHERVRPVLHVVGRLLRPAIEVDLELDLELPDVLVETSELFVNARRCAHISPCTRCGIKAMSGCLRTPKLRVV